MRRRLILISMLMPAILFAAEAHRDSAWYKGHEYRQWIYDQNRIGDKNSNLDPAIDFVADGRIRIHPDRVYFYDDIDLAIQIAKETGYPLAFYLFDHTCSTCLYRLPQVYSLPEIVEKSRNFVNVYVELPRYAERVNALGMMNSSLTVQFFLPSMRRLRVLDDADADNLLGTYDEILAYWSKLTEKERLDRSLELKRSRAGYR